MRFFLCHDYTCGATLSALQSVISVDDVLAPLPKKAEAAWIIKLFS